MAERSTVFATLTGTRKAFDDSKLTGSIPNRLMVVGIIKPCETPGKFAFDLDGNEFTTNERKREHQSFQLSIGIMHGTRRYVKNVVRWYSTG